MPYGIRQETGRPVKIKDEGLTLVSNVKSIDFVGDGVDGSAIGNDITETIDGGVGSIILTGDVTGSGTGSIVTTIGNDVVKDSMIDWGTGTNQVSSADIPDHNAHTVRDTFVYTINRGVTSTITITLTGGLGVSWIAGELYCQSCETFFSVGAGSGTCTNNAVNYLKWVSGTTLTLSTTEPSGDEILVAVGSVYDGNINGYREVSPMNETVSNTRRGLRALFPTRIISGMSVHEDTDVTNPLDVTMDAGVLWKDAIEQQTPIEIKSRNTAMVRNFHTGGVWTSDTNSQIETTNYDNGTNLVAIPAGKHVKGMFIYMNGKIGFVYPREYFNTIAQAQDASLPPMPTGLEPIPKLTAIVYQQGAVNFTNSIWQDVRAGISEESFSGVTDHGALAGLSDDDHTQYTLADGTRAFTGTQIFNENIEMKDDKKLYLDTAKGSSIRYSSAHGTMIWDDNGYFTMPGEMNIMANSGADGSGTWEPIITLEDSGKIDFTNTTQGDAANRYLSVTMTSGMRLRTTGLAAFIKADNIATTNKTFQFPNASGTFALTSSNITGTAANLSGTPALPNGTTATSQAGSDNSTKLATTAYVDAAVVGGGATVALDNLASVAINTSLVSDTDITDNLGTGDVRWKDTWFQTISAGLTAADTLKLRGRDVDGSAYVDILTITSNNTVTADLNALVTIGGNAILYSGGDAGTPSALVGTNISGTASSLSIGGTAAVATTVTITDNEVTDEANPIVFVAGADPDGGNLGLETDGTCTYNPSTGIITTTGFVGVLTGNVTGNADTVTGFTPASGSLTLSGADALTLTTTAATNITLPTSGTLLANVVDDTTPELGGEMDCGAHSIGFTQQSTTGDGTTTIDWKLGNKFKFTFGAQNDTFTFTAPSNPCNLVLVLIQDGTGSRTATWPGTVKWAGGTAPTLSTAANAIDIVSFYYDGTSYFGVASLLFSVPA